MSSLNERLLSLKREQLRRLTAQTNLVPFIEYTYPKYQAASHHHKLAAQLERVERGEIDRLMVEMPPRHGKSEQASVRFPAWYLGRNPDRQFISASATAELASDFGRQVRNIVGSEEYHRLFDTRLAEDSAAKGRWSTTAGGFYYAVGVGGAILGRGAHVALIDDPFGSMEDAQSETIRNRVWDWYRGTIYNRLEPGGAIILINHRMHEDDLSGRLLAEQGAGGDTWEVVEMPAISDSGEALWPERYPIEALERIKRNTANVYWSALYQQKPAPDEGAFFKREWLRWYESKPNHLQVYGASDYAVTDQGGDYTVHVVVGVDPEDNVYVLDLWRGQTEPDIWADTLLDLANVWKPLNWGEEQGQIIKSVGPFLRKRMNERRVYFARRQFTSVRDKPTRARSFQGRMAMGKVYFPRGATWAADLETELMQFPMGKHDDQVDALSLVGRMLDSMIGGSLPEPEPEPVDSWDRAFGDDDDGESWRTV